LMRMNLREPSSGRWLKPQDASHGSTRIHTDQNQNTILGLFIRVNPCESVASFFSLTTRRRSRSPHCRCPSPRAFWL
jgi:hypothetical protein